MDQEIVEKVIKEKQKLKKKNTFIKIYLNNIENKINNVNVIGSISNGCI